VSTSIETLLESRAAQLGVSLNPLVAERLVEYFHLLVHWNKRINLTSLPVEQPTESAVERLLIEPLLAIPVIAPSASSWFDLGSGGGSPAIPLQIARPTTKLFMIESRERKAAFLREAVRELQLEGAEVLADRIETIAESPTYAKAADLVTVRAVKLSAPLFSHLDALLKNGGQAILFGAAPQLLHTSRSLEIQYVEPPLVVLRRAK
jgi:16S rRNA (guanine527-N7)-methyltransferase